MYVQPVLMIRCGSSQAAADHLYLLEGNIYEVGDCLEYWESCLSKFTKCFFISVSRYTSVCDCLN